MKNWMYEKNGRIVFDDKTVMETSLAELIEHKIYEPVAGTDGYMLNQEKFMLLWNNKGFLT